MAILRQERSKKAFATHVCYALEYYDVDQTLLILGWQDENCVF